MIYIVIHSERHSRMWLQGMFRIWIDGSRISNTMDILRRENEIPLRQRSMASQASGADIMGNSMICSRGRICGS
jgi:hypothetical protein